jgi:uncharacterized phage protein gp47/JayE
VAIFRSFSEIVNSMRERLRLTQPNLDTKTGTVSRDVFIDIQADQLERLHSSMLLVSEKQSPEVATGKDLDRWANNFGISRTSGSPANGIVVFTTNQITSDMPIPSGTLVTSRNGLSYRTIGSFIMSVAEKNRFSANASRLRSALDLAGISDSFAIEIPVQAGNSGTTGNISSFQVIENNLEDSLKVTNLTSFNGGANTESDAAFRSRVFAVFSGSNTGTAFGYRNAALSISGVNDAIVIEPGNTLMLRDGTETIEINDGSFRILSSGTGGKVDLYILGTQLEEIVESYVFTDKSGTGSADDERNDFIVGQGTLDSTLTSEERRVKAFNEGILPLQPVDDLVSVIGSSSGILSAQTTDDDGITSGNYILVKDLNVDTGGSPFGFDKLRFVSSEKEVEAESIIKQSINSVDALRFSGSSDLIGVFQDISILSENSTVSSADKTIIKLKHSPILTASRVRNKTTGEIYVIESQNIDESLGYNTTGEIVISGKTLPSAADVLSVDYIWRLFYDKYIDYNGEYTGAQFLDSSVNDSIDWGVSNGITSETSIIERTDDGLEYQIQANHSVSRVISVYSATLTTGTLENVEGSGGVLVPGVTISAGDEAISSIVSIKNENGVEIYNTINSDGSFSGRTVILPSDAAPGDSTVASVFYNKTELYDISDSDGSSANDIITLPSEDILESSDVLDEVNSLFLTGEDMYIDYMAEVNEVVPSVALTLLPINGSESSNDLFDSSLSTITGSNQPIFYTFDTSGDITGAERFGPTRLSMSVSGTTRSGKIKVSGESIARLDLDVVAGVSVDGFKFDMGPSIRDALGLSSIPTNIGIARVDSIVSLDNASTTVDLIGHKLDTNIYGFGVVELDASLDNDEFVIPSTTNNVSLSFSSGEVLRVSILVYNVNDTEDLFFAGNSTVITDKLFARIDRIAVSSGFRSTAGSLIGSIIIKPTSQPGVGLSYSANYKFIAPVEGERITVRYNLNRLISDVTANLENVRSITADVLVKETPILDIDVGGEVIVNEDVISEKDTVLENVSNAVVNLLNSSTLGSTVDYSDIINAATSVTGVDSVNISLFNESGETGRRSFVKALDNQSIAAGEVSFVSIARKDFRIT